MQTSPLASPAFSSVSTCRCWLTFATLVRTRWSPAGCAAHGSGCDRIKAVAGLDADAALHTLEGSEAPPRPHDAYQPEIGGCPGDWLSVWLSVHGLSYRLRAGQWLTVVDGSGVRALKDIESGPCRPVPGSPGARRLSTIQPPDRRRASSYSRGARAWLGRRAVDEAAAAALEGLWNRHGWDDEPPPLALTVVG